MAETLSGPAVDNGVGHVGIAPRKLPRLDRDNRFFWTSGADGRLRFLRCDQCAQFVHPPRPICPACLGEALTPAVVAGTGVIDTFTINRQKWRPDTVVPCVIARIAIDGAPGVVLTSNVVDVDPQAVTIGAAVEVVFIPQEDVYLPMFRMRGGHG
ncbi:Zn-ribbon domain-containing OB-fold protein [Sphingomonas flavalba]|uniref:Zn-ribbon domain-containing OB-fold protein n=1 Tax=Sphingomonas flavalba TaxID=2559804 RepID=UPI0039E15323